ncbi:MAG: hypothetical protein Q9186_000625 [Xanthomendoza sp. 1 TL-2023]
MNLIGVVSLVGHCISDSTTAVHQDEYFYPQHIQRRVLNDDFCYENVSFCFATTVWKDLKHDTEMHLQNGKLRIVVGTARLKVGQFSPHFITPENQLSIDLF